MNRYLAISGCIREYFEQDFNVIYSDADLLFEITRLGLDRRKTMTLLKYLLESNRIVWNKSDEYRKSGSEEYFDDNYFV